MLTNILYVFLVLFELRVFGPVAINDEGFFAKDVKSGFTNSFTKKTIDAEQAKFSCENVSWIEKDGIPFETYKLFKINTLILIWIIFVFFPDPISNKDSKVKSVVVIEDEGLRSEKPCLGSSVRINSRMSQTIVLHTCMIWCLNIMKYWRKIRIQTKCRSRGECDAA